MAFKMKRWSGYQSSPIQQKIDLKTKLTQGFQNLQTNIENIFKGGGDFKPKTIAYDPTTKRQTSGFGLTELEKKQAKKLGMSEYQWKTGVGISHSQRHHKRMFDKKHGLGRYAPEEEKPFIGPRREKYVDPNIPTDPLSQEIADTSELETQDLETQDKEESGDWITRKNDPWAYKKTEFGYQTKDTRKGDDAKIIDVTDKSSEAYKSISEKVFDIKVDQESPKILDWSISGMIRYGEEYLKRKRMEELGETKEVKKKKEKKKTVPWYVSDAIPNLTYEEYMENKDAYDNSLDPTKLEY